MTDYRALCAELLGALQRAQRSLEWEGGCSERTSRKRSALIARARAALTMPRQLDPDYDDNPSLTAAERNPSLK
jgi:hypothetical protein